MGRPHGGGPRPSAALAVAVVEDAAVAPLIHGAGRADQVDELPEACLAQAIALSSPRAAIICVADLPRRRGLRPRLAQAPTRGPCCCYTNHNMKPGPEPAPQMRQIAIGR
jgi:hypothetical protein